MKTRTPAMKLRLGALALGIGVAAQAAPVIQSIEMLGAQPRLGIQSDVGSTNEIQYSADLGQTNWTVLTNLVVAASPYWFVDGGRPGRDPAILPGGGLPDEQPCAHGHGAHTRRALHDGEHLLPQRGRQRRVAFAHKLCERVLHGQI